MGKGRLEALSDGVIAIAITIMVLGLEVPHEATLRALERMAPVLFGYVLSFVHVGIYWNNHHHLFQAVRAVDGTVLWLNLHFLFWLSLLPFVTAWMGSSGYAAAPVSLYGGVLFMCAAAYLLLAHRLARRGNRMLALAIGADRKGWISLLLYACGVGLGCVRIWMGLAIYVAVALVWFIPDRRIERYVGPASEIDPPLQQD